jgi:hypothetical protein
VTHDEEVFGVFAVLEEALEILEGCGGCERVGLQDRGFVSGLGPNERRSLEAALERAGDDEVELDVECTEDVGELDAVTLALLIERSLGVEERVDAPSARAGMAKNKEVHK